MTELPKTFDPARSRIAGTRIGRGGACSGPSAPTPTPWTIVMPPPNVTGSLHIGHALDITLQDVLTRRERMLRQGRAVGGRHRPCRHRDADGGRAQPREPGIKRAEIGREEFLEQVWEWKAQSGRRDHPPAPPPRRQLRLGARALHHGRGLTSARSPTCSSSSTSAACIYRDKRLVNWDPKFQTAISDLEVETRDVQGKFWTLRYPLADGSGAIEVATTRPETMLADMAVAVHPDDERYKALVGKQIRHPITGRLIPIIADEHADPELGSGAVKITPGHDFNDFEVGKRAGFKPADMLNMLDAEAHVVQTQDGLIPQDLLGLDRARTRARRWSRMLEDEGALVRVEDRVIPTPFGDRSGVVIEPWLTDQWYVDAAKLAQPAIAGGASGRHQDRARDLGKDLVQLAREYPALVRLAPALVGPPDPGLV